jgi:hypothetical protein
VLVVPIRRIDEGQRRQFFRCLLWYWDLFLPLAAPIVTEPFGNLIGDLIAKLFAHCGKAERMSAGMKGLGLINRGLEAIAPFLVAGGARDGFGSEPNVRLALAGAGEKAADNERSVMAGL